MAEALIDLCKASELKDGGDAVPFDVLYWGEPTRAFAIRYAGRVHAYLNRCSHVPMEMDYQANRFFDMSGHWLICATHGATYSPTSGACHAGPCRGGLVKIAVVVSDGMVRWHTAHHLTPATP